MGLSKGLRYGGQAIGSMLILALPIGNVLKLGLFLVFWAATFGRLTRREWIAAITVWILFTAMDLGTVQHGGFNFKHPDFRGIAFYAPMIYFFLFFNAMRMLAGPVPETRPPWLAWVLGMLFCIPFLAIQQPHALLGTTSALLLLALVFFHGKFDMLYMMYLVVLGTVIEHVAVWSGQWSYPNPPWGGVPFWSLTMWAGIGLFVRRLLYPLVYR